MVFELSDDEPIFTPSEFVEHETRARGMKEEEVRIPSQLIMVYNPRYLRYLRRITDSKVVKWWYSGQRPLHIGHYRSKLISFLCNWIGAPAASMMFEEVIAFGAREIIEVGVAGGIQPYLRPGDILLVTGARRDEGTSYHYFPPGVEVGCSPELCKRIEDYFIKQSLKYHKGTVWTTDGVYRETRGKFRRFQKEGVLAVNMETSALLAVARYRNVKLSSLQVISDVLSETGWLLAFGSKEVQNSIRKAIKVALEALA